MMKPHDQLTIVRNLHRARELRLFRDLVESYFERSERDVNDVPMDWEGAQAARSRINQMLARVIQIVGAAGLGGSVGTAATTDPGPALGRVEVLQRIFSARYGDGLDQEIMDVLDMALGVYEGGRFMALARTICITRGSIWLIRERAAWAPSQSIGTSLTSRSDRTKYVSTRSRKSRSSRARWRFRTMVS